MNSESRSRIMARIRGTSAGQSAEHIARDLSTFGTAPAASLLHANTAIAFIARALKNQASVAVAEDRIAAVKAIGHYLYEHHRSHRLVSSNAPQLAAMPWRDGGVLPRFGDLEPGEPVTLAYAPWAIAETGALVTTTGKHNPALNHFLPEQQIVLVETQNILVDMEQLWAVLTPALEQTRRPRAIHCIAGPSSTADVEATLVKGAHGPSALHIVLLGKLPEDALAKARHIAGA